MANRECPAERASGPSREDRDGLLERAFPPLRTPYTKVVDGLLERMKALCPRELYPKAANVLLVVDSTGVGRGIADMIHSAIDDIDFPNISLWPCTITGGTGRHSVDGGFWTLPKQEMIFTGGVIPLQDGRLRWGPNIPERKVLEEELLNYRKKINIATNNTQFEPWRESEHDDLLFALCLAGWAWRKFEIAWMKVGGEAEIPPPTPESAGRTPLTGEPLPPLP
jgi:hypothetical protein